MLAVYPVNEARFLELKRWTERKRSAPKYPGQEEMLASAGNCQQVPADVGGCRQLPPPTPTPTPTTTPERERSGAGTPDADEAPGPAVVVADVLGPDGAREWGILKARLADLERRLESAEGDQRRELLGDRKKTRAAFEALSKAQAEAVAAKRNGGAA